MEGAFEVDNPWVLLRYCEDITLLSGLDDFVLEDHFGFLEFLDGYRLTGLIPLAQSHLTKRSLADDFQRCEVHYSDFGTFLPQNLRLFMDDLLLDLSLLCVREL